MGILVIVSLLVLSKYASHERSSLRDLLYQYTSRWRHNGHDGVSSHQPHDCLLNRRSKKKPKLRVTGLCAENSPGTGEFPAQMASNAENVPISWRRHDLHGNDRNTKTVQWLTHWGRFTHTRIYVSKVILPTRCRFQHCQAPPCGEIVSKLAHHWLR